MFGTLRYDLRNDDTEFIEREHSFASDMSCRVPQHSACDNCRAKKIRCTGQKSGCFRCQTLSIPCTYSDPAKTKGSRKRALAATQDSGKESRPTSAASKPAEGATVAAEAASESSDVEQQPQNAQPEDFPMDDGVFDHASFGHGPGLEDNGGIMTAAWSDLADIDWNCFEKQIESSRFQHSQTASGIHSTGNSSPTNTSTQDRVPKPINPPFNTGSGVFATPPQSVDLSPFFFTRRARLANIEKLASPAASSRCQLFRSFIAPPSPIPTTQMPQTCTNAGPSKSIVSQIPCKCLQLAVFFLDELDTRRACRKNGISLDAALWSHKETLGFLQQILHCTQFPTRPENMMILNLILDKLIGLCEEIVERYLHQMDPRNATAEKPCVAAHLPNTTAEAQERQDIYFGDYQVDHVEWESLVRVLIILQLRGLEEAVRKMKLSSLAQREAQMSKLLRSESRLSEVVKKMQA